MEQARVGVQRVWQRVVGREWRVWHWGGVVWQAGEMTRRVLRLGKVVWQARKGYRRSGGRGGLYGRLGRGERVVGVRWVWGK